MVTALWAMGLRPVRMEVIAMEPWGFFPNVSQAYSTAGKALLFKSRSLVLSDIHCAPGSVPVALGWEPGKLRPAGKTWLATCSCIYSSITT